jgi:hypothetical protein
MKNVLRNELSYEAFNIYHVGKSGILGIGTLDMRYTDLKIFHFIS